MTYACFEVWQWNSTAYTQISVPSVMTCNGTGWTWSSTAFTGQATVTITLAPTQAMLERSSTVSLAALLGIPLFALVGWVKGRKSKSSRKNFFRFLGLIVALAAGISYATGCGGNFSNTATNTTSGLAAGSYLVQVNATDSASHVYSAMVPLTVNPY
jgi:hypothetical protein